MKIAILYPYPPNIGNQKPILPGTATQGGGETSTFRFAQKLVERGHDVTFFAAKYKGITVKKIEISNNFRIIYLDTIFKNMGPAFSLRLLFDLIFGKYDIIHSHQIPIMFSLIGGIAAKLSRKRFIITFHGRLPGYWLDQSVGYISSCLADAVTVQNDFAYKLVRKFVPENKLVVIPHGVDTELFYKQQPNKNLVKKYKSRKEIIVIFVGRLIPQKGIHILIKAIYKVKNKLNIRLWIVGDGPLKNALMKQCHNLKLEDNVKFWGAVSQKKLPLFYNLSNILVLPSTNYDIDGKRMKNICENFGLVLAEAMACQVPVVASNMGGIPKWIKNEKNGLLFKEDDYNDLSKQIIRLTYDKRLRSKLVKKALQDIITKYSWDVICGQFECLYNREKIKKFKV